MEVDRRRETGESRRETSVSRASTMKNDREKVRRNEATHDGGTTRNPLSNPLDLDHPLLVAQHVREEDHLDGGSKLAIPPLERLEQRPRRSRVRQPD